MEDLALAPRFELLPRVVFRVDFLPTGLPREVVLVPLPAPREPAAEARRPLEDLADPRFDFPVPLSRLEVDRLDDRLPVLPADSESTLDLLVGLSGFFLGRRFLTSPEAVLRSARSSPPVSYTHLTLPTIYPV